MIEAVHLTKEFGVLRAVDDVSFSIDRGTIAGFLGPNGAGKTTTMRMLVGVFPPTSGEARVAGFSAIDDPIEARRRIGYLPETTPLYPDLEVDTYLDFVGKLKGIDRSKRAREVGEVTERCGLAHMRSRIVGNLSKGYRQRVGLAQALLGNPEVLVLDEPTIGLDPEQVTEIRGLIAELRGERTILLSSHILSEVSLLCQEVVVIHGGRILAKGAPEALAEHLRPSIRALLRVEAPIEEVVARLSAVDGVLSSEATAPDAVRLEVQDEAALREVSRVIQDRRWLLLELKRETLGLEDVFLSLVRREAEGPDA